MNDFDEDMVHLTKAHHIFDQRMGDQRLYLKDEKVLVFYRNGLLFAFNFHPSQSLTDVEVPVPNRADYTVAMSSDDEKYGGQGNVAHIKYPMRSRKKEPFIRLYLPARTVVVLKEGKVKAERPSRAAKTVEQPAEAAPKAKKTRAKKTEKA